MTVQFVASRFGGSIAVRDLSADDLRSSEPNLLFLHPVTFHGNTWKPIVSRLSHRGRRFAIDQPGHGLSRLVVERPLDWYAIADDVLAVVDALAAQGIENPVGVGHSMGGAMLTIAEVLRPGTFRGLWLYEPVVPPTRTIPAELQAAKNTRSQARPRRTEFPSVDTAYESYRAKLPRFDAESLRAYVDDAFDVAADGSATLRCDPDIGTRIADVWPEHRIFDRVDEVKCPVHLVRGNLAGYQARWAAALVHHFPDATLERQDQLTHLGPLEEPATMARSINAALPRLMRGRLDDAGHRL